MAIFKRDDAGINVRIKLISYRAKPAWIDIETFKQDVKRRGFFGTFYLNPESLLFRGKIAGVPMVSANLLLDWRGLDFILGANCLSSGKEELPKMELEPFLPHLYFDDGSVAYIKPIAAERGYFLKLFKCRCNKFEEWPTKKELKAAIQIAKEEVDEEEGLEADSEGGRTPKRRLASMFS